MLPQISSIWTLSGGKLHRNAALTQTVLGLTVTLMTLVNCTKSEFGEKDSTVFRLFLLRHLTVLNSRLCPQKKTTPKTTNVGTGFGIGKIVLNLTPLTHPLIPFFLILLNLQLVISHQDLRSSPPRGKWTAFRQQILVFASVWVVSTIDVKCHLFAIRGEEHCPVHAAASANAGAWQAISLIAPGSKAQTHLCYQYKSQQKKYEKKESVWKRDE